MSADSLGDRMKAYEAQPRAHLVPRMPTIIRIDGRAFHTYTRGLPAFHRPLMYAMDATARALCEDVQTTQLAFVQSDEISLLLHPYKRYATQPWFDGGVQKMVSVAASIAAATFTLASASIFDDGEPRAATFDARVWVLPESEVCNYFLWRQQDWTRNSIQMLARSLASHRECDHKNQAQLQDLIHARGHNWNDLPVHLKRGRCVRRVQTEHVDGTQRSRWVVDMEPPIFSEDRAYVERLLAVEAEG